MGCVTDVPWVLSSRLMRADLTRSTDYPDSVQGRGTRGWNFQNVPQSLYTWIFFSALQLPSAFLPPLQTGYYPWEVHPLLPGP